MIILKVVEYTVTIILCVLEIVVVYILMKDKQEAKKSMVIAKKRLDDKALVNIANNMLKMGTKSQVQKDNILKRINNERRLWDIDKKRLCNAFIKKDFTRLSIEDLEPREEV